MQQREKLGFRRQNLSIYEDSWKSVLRLQEKPKVIVGRRIV